MMVAVLLGALSLGACVDDNESASVTDLRGAKAEQLRSLAALNEAKAEAELIRANAEAALKEAKAAHEQALADNQQIENDKIQQEYANDLEEAQLRHEKEMLRLQQELADKQESVLADKYAGELLALIELQKELLDKQVWLAKYEAGLISGDAAELETIATQNAIIAKAEAQLAVLNSEEYKALDNTELLAKAQAKFKEFEVAKAAFASDASCTELASASEAVANAADVLAEQIELVDAINSDYSVVIAAAAPGVATTVSYKYYENIAYFAQYTYSNSLSVYENARIDESAKLQKTRDLEKKAEETAALLGAREDKADATYTDESGIAHPTAYSMKAKAADDKKAAEDFKKTFEALAKDATATIDGVTYTKESGLKEAERRLAQAETDAAAAEDMIAEATANKDAAAEALQEYKDALAELDLDAYNKAVADLEAANEKFEVAEEAWIEAKQVVIDIQSEAIALNFMANNAAADIDGMIADLEKTKADAQKILDDIEADKIEGEGWAEIYQEEIDGLELQIEAQKQIVEAAKAALEASINETPAEDTPAEDTPSEEQPAA